MAIAARSTCHAPRDVRSLHPLDPHAQLRKVLNLCPDVAHVAAQREGVEHGQVLEGVGKRLEA
eukprot:11700444-Alexandrium_andersonii.AAC.1